MNSTQTSYGFGQFGSAFIDHDEAIFIAPHELVVVGIQIVTEAAFTDLIAETKSTPLIGDAAGGGTSSTHVNRGKEYFGTQYAAHDLGDCMIAGASSTGGTTVTHTANTAGLHGKSAIKVGMQVASVNTTPLYPRDGLLGRPVIIKEILTSTTFRVSENAVGTTLTSQSLVGLAMHSSAYGGAAIDTGNTFPAGLTMFGRWVRMRLSKGSVIVYLGA
jgi:hypothetical protein